MLAYGICFVACLSFDTYTWWKFSLQSTETFLNVHWMLTECSQTVHRITEFRHCSVTFQWAFSLTDYCWIAGTFQWPISIFFYLQKKKLKHFHQIMGSKVISLWITTHEKNLKNGEKHYANGLGRTRVICSLLLLNRYRTSTTGCFTPNPG